MSLWRQLGRALRAERYYRSAQWHAARMERYQERLQLHRDALRRMTVEVRAFAAEQDRKPR